MKKRQYHHGRRVSKGEKAIAEYFDNHNILYVQEKTFRDCVNDNGNALRFDFYLEQFNLLIEYQGHHHDKPVNKYRRAKIVHEKTVIHDAIKEAFAESNRINLKKIHYKDYNNINKILDELFTEINNYLENNP